MLAAPPPPLPWPFLCFCQGSEVPALKSAPTHTGFHELLGRSLHPLGEVAVSFHHPGLKAYGPAPLGGPIETSSPSQVTQKQQQSSPLF